MKNKIIFLIFFFLILLVSLNWQDRIASGNTTSLGSNPGGYVGYRFEHNYFSKFDIFFNWTNIPQIYPVGIYPCLLQFWFQSNQGGYIGPQIELSSKDQIVRKLIFTIWSMNNETFTVHPYAGDCSYSPNDIEGKNVQCRLRDLAWEEGKLYKITVQQDTVLEDGVVWKATITDLQNNSEVLIGKIKLDDQTPFKGYGALQEYTGGFFEYYFGSHNECFEAEYGRIIRIGPYADGKWLANKGTYDNGDCLRSLRSSPRIGTIIEQVGQGVERSPNDPVKGILWDLIHDVPLSILITTPLENANISGMVPIMTYVASESQIQRVEFFIDDFLEAIDIDAPYEFNWNAEEYPPGSHKIKAVVYDVLGKTDFYETWVTRILKPPTISLSKANLYYGSTSGGTSSKTQSVLISNSGGETLNWTAAPQQSWINVSPGSGTGTGTINVGINASNLGTGTYTGAITVSDPDATNNPQIVSVTLKVYAPGWTAAPFGTVDTPLEGTTGIEGNIPVTGWALDDIEVTGVKIWRDPVGDEPVHPNGFVYLGDAVFIEGARPDVEQAYPGYPLNYRAGWGFMVLTNYLPNMGNGTFRIHAIAYDKEGNSTLIGSKTITCDNVHATLPFGTIDTPGQGGIVSGNYVNFGWALTPMPKSIPTDGSTMLVWVDSLPVAHPIYNNYRVDIATLFPDYANSKGAVGYYYLDTTAYTNGLHSIAWSVKDSDNKVSGIGSRFFWILNTGAGAMGAGNELSTATFTNIIQFTQRFGSVLDLAHITSDYCSPIFVTIGYKLNQLFETICPDKNSVRKVEIRETERAAVYMDTTGIEEEKPAGVGLEAKQKTHQPLRNMLSESTGWTGYLIVGQDLRPLPAGSSFDSKAGVFTWQPGPGFIGEYDLVFVNQAAGQEASKRFVKIVIKPKFAFSSSEKS
jgi:hypothetical protein